MKPHGICCSCSDCRHAICEVRDVQTVTVERRYTLTLTEKQALVLMRVLGRVGGSPDGPRGDTDVIFTGLSSAGVTLQAASHIPVEGDVMLGALD